MTPLSVNGDIGLGSQSNNSLSELVQDKRNIDDTSKFALVNGDVLKNSPENLSSDSTESAATLAQKISKKKKPRRVSLDPYAVLLDAAVEGELDLVKLVVREVLFWNISSRFFFFFSFFLSFFNPSLFLFSFFTIFFFLPFYFPFFPFSLFPFLSNFRSFYFSLYLSFFLSSNMSCFRLPLTIRSDSHESSPYNFHTLSYKQVRRIDKIITHGVLSCQL